MSAERYKISECELDVLAITGPEGTYYIDGENIEARAIRQQSADIAELRAELAAAVAERDNLRRCFAKACAKRAAAELRAEQAESQLAAIEAAPTVAVVCSSECFGAFVQQRFFGSELPNIGTDLIARPAKD